MVLDKAAELAIALSKSDEFVKFVEAKKNVEQDSLSSNLLYNYSYVENQLDEMMETDSGDAEEIKTFVNAMLDLRDQIISNKLISRLIIAQNAFQSLMEQINIVVEKYVFADIEFSEDSKYDDKEPRYMN